MFFCSHTYTHRHTYTHIHCLENEQLHFSLSVHANNTRIHFVFASFRCPLAWAKAWEKISKEIRLFLLNMSHQSLSLFSCFTQSHLLRPASIESYRNSQLFRCCFKNIDTYKLLYTEEKLWFCCHLDSKFRFFNGSIFFRWYDRNWIKSPNCLPN